MIHSLLWNWGISGWGSESSSDFFSSSASEFPEMLKKDTNWGQDFGTKMELLFLFVSGNITPAKSFSQFDAGMSLMFMRCLRSPCLMTTGTTSTAFLARFDRGLCWRISSESRNFQIVLPLLNIPTGEQWHYLKDKNLRKMAKGLEPRILLSVTLVFNP